MTEERSAPVAVVTGAGRGIGRAIAVALARRGCDVAILSRSMAPLEETAGAILGCGQRVLALRCDVARAEDVSRACAAVIDELGVPRVVVPNAGVVRRVALAEMSEADWDAVVDVNLKGTFLLARALVGPMRDRGVGRFVSIGSISSTTGTATLTSYCAAKWGVVGFTKALAEELRGTGLQAMCVLPGSTDTDMLKGSGFAPQMSPDDVAGAVVYAALDAPAAMNGSAIEVFGP